MTVLYTASATAVGGRLGRVVSSDNVLDLDLKTPKELGGPGGYGTNPEQLFAAGYSACFDSALNLVIKTQRVKEVTSTAVTANVSIFKGENNGFKLAVELEAEVEGVDKETAQKLVEAAHQVCPYSNATRGNIEVTLKVV
ncbi:MULTISPECIES: organic hydroperoxide resistance protein [Rummeliibacillus]|uniref:Ohr subfamily peroxiredoxin n=1 Tax=Rummeliibacillus stabekisii TaxID=241244 RepID=A0A143HFT2_9BACL|nr:MULTISPECIES: organic hydroperoxide resistance protein [Rummeliibacillus]AMX00575.1 Ohr subfamily peroxiredoxin [Rummeliibacillus stabekisii]MBB5171196.1 Ohr subfamily peroxiredoxin [Rummeliibacillus stabekisii]MCM3317600.1 organic hydroperoxide resistance protein [Rummeliibacillus stabekisii]GEL06099.1 organic hydroperoxide resistance protein [Rummeliibacillus stabekisii]